MFGDSASDGTDAWLALQIAFKLTLRASSEDRGACPFVPFAVPFETAILARSAVSVGLGLAGGSLRVRADDVGVGVL